MCVEDKVSGSYLVPKMDEHLNKIYRLGKEIYSVDSDSDY